MLQSQRSSQPDPELLECALNINAFLLDLLPEVVHYGLVLVLELPILLLFLNEIAVEDVVPQQLIPAESLVLIDLDTLEDEILCNWRDLQWEVDLLRLDVSDKLVLGIPEPRGSTEDHLN